MGAARGGALVGVAADRPQPPPPTLSSLKMDTIACQAVAQICIILKMVWGVSKTDGARQAPPPRAAADAAQPTLRHIVSSRDGIAAQHIAGAFDEAARGVANLECASVGDIKGTTRAAQ